jgi:hypothetical protein
MVAAHPRSTGAAILPGDATAGVVLVSRSDHVEVTPFHVSLGPAAKTTSMR